MVEVVFSFFKPTGFNGDIDGLFPFFSFKVSCNCVSKHAQVRRDGHGNHHDPHKEFSKHVRQYLQLVCQRQDHERKFSSTGQKQTRTNAVSLRQPEKGT